MAVVAVVSAKGSPGVTTLALGLAAVWPGGEAVLVEADPAGGDLSARFGLPADPGLAEMALAARQDEPVESARWVQRLPCGVHVVLAARGAAASASLAALAERGRLLLGRLAGDYPAVIVDCGRWGPGSSALGLLSAADVVLLVARPVLEEIGQAQARVRALAALNRRLELVVAGERGRWPAAEVAAAVGLPLGGVVPTDRQGAGVLAGRLVPRRGWRRSGWSSWTRLPLLRACHSLALRLDTQPRPAPPTSATAVPAADPPVPVPARAGSATGAGGLGVVRP